MRRPLALLLVALLTAPPAAVAPAPAQEPPPGYYLERPRGPYRGRVIDAETRRPIAGAVVVARWTREIIRLLQMPTVGHAVRETLTDADGAWVIGGRDVEEAAPPRLHPPHFVIFVPGYGAFPHAHTAPRGRMPDIFEGAGATVELPPLRTREDRVKLLLQIYPRGLSQDPFRELPELMRRLNEESMNLGLQPFSR